MCVQQMYHESAMQLSPPVTIFIISTFNQYYQIIQYLSSNRYKIQDILLMNCCPVGSWQQLKVDYHPKGEDLEVDGVPLYHVGDGKRAIVIISDIFGAKSGRHRSVADIFASLKYNVFLPEILSQPFQNGVSTIPEYIKGQEFSALNKNFQKIKSYLHQKGIDKFFAIGLCWGVWFAFRASVIHKEIWAIAGPHPSLGVEQMFGGNPVQLSSQIQCPAFLLPAENDPPNVKQNGEVIQNLSKKFGKENVGTLQFPEMKHGWVVRGEINDEKVARDVNLAIHEIHNYFQKFN